MSFIPLRQRRNVLVNTQLDLVDEITDFLVNTCGWTLHDDQRSSQYPFVILKSAGEQDSIYPCYVKFWDRTSKYATNAYMDIIFYSYWDNETHTGRNMRSYAIETQTLAVNAGGVFFDYNGGNVVSFFGNKDFFSCFISTPTNGHNSFLVTRLQPITTGDCMVSQLSTAGGNADIYFDESTPISDNFIVGGEYVSVNHIGQFDYVKVNNLDYANNKITVNELVWNLDVGSSVGSFPYRWLFYYNNSNSDDDVPRATYIYNKYRIDKYSDNTNQLGYRYVRHYRFSEYTLIYNPDYYIHGGQNAVIPFFFRDEDGGTSSGIIGSSDYIFNSGVGENFDTLGNGRLGSGMPTAATSTTLTDSSKSWTPNEFANKAVVIVNGTNAGDIKLIQSNTADTLTISENWQSNLDSSSEYVIYNNAFHRMLSRLTDPNYNYVIRVV